MLTMGDRLFDADFNRWLVIDGACMDPNYMMCVVYRYGDPGELEIAGRGMFHKQYLLDLKRGDADDQD